MLVGELAGEDLRGRLEGATPGCDDARDGTVGRRDGSVSTEAAATEGFRASSALRPRRDPKEASGRNVLASLEGESLLPVPVVRDVPEPVKLLPAILGEPIVVVKGVNAEANRGLVLRDIVDSSQLECVKGW